MLYHSMKEEGDVCLDTNEILGNTAIFSTVLATLPYQLDSSTRLSGSGYTGFRRSLQDREANGAKQNAPNAKQFDPHIDGYQHIQRL